MANRVFVNFKAQARMFFRNPGAVFWTVAFPVLLIVVFGAIFSGSGSSTYTLHVQNLDQGPFSEGYIQGLNSTKMVNVVLVDANASADAYIKDNSISSFLIIPENFSSSIIAKQPAYLELRADMTSSSSQAIMTVVNGVASGMALNISDGTPIIINQGSIAAGSQFSFIDFFLPGVIGLTIMNTCVQWMLGTQTRYRNTGIFRKLATTPMSHSEWLLSLTLWQIVVVFISVGVIILVGIGMYGMHVNLDAVSIAMIIAASIMFTSMGLIIARFVKDEETAGAAAGAITFPMMFLAGSFFPLEMMPSYLQAIAKVLPLTYVNDGLRDAMIYGNESAAVGNLVIVLVLAVILAIIGVLISTWKQD